MRSVRLLAWAILGSTALAWPDPTHADSPATVPVVVSFLHPISTHPDSDVRTPLGLSLLYGDLAGVSGLDLNGVVSRARGDVRGLHATGAYSRIDGDFAGAALVLGGSWVRGDANGIQVSGIATVNQGDVTGITGAGLVNLVDGRFVGIQLAVAANLVDRDATGLFFSGFGNVVNGNARGISLASAYNYTGGRATGLQFAGANFAARVDGVQLGIGNFTKEARGLQIGAFNYAESQKGLPFGFVNVAKNGVVEAVAYTSSLAAVNIGVRTEVNHFTSMVTLGGFDQVGEVERTVIFRWNFGLAFHPIRRIELGADVGIAHYVPEVTPGDPDPALNHAGFETRVLLGVELTRHVRVLLGAGGAMIYDSYEEGATAERHDLWLAGLAVR